MAFIVRQMKYWYPPLLAVILVIFSSVSLAMPGTAHFMPMIEVMIIYYWCIFRPYTMPSWFVFLLGIFKDILSGAPLGISSLTFLILRPLAIFRREFFLKCPFLIIWQGFALFALIALIIKWLVFSFVYEKFLGLNMAVMQLIFSISIYPLFHSLFNHIHATLPGDPVDA